MNRYSWAFLLGLLVCGCEYDRYKITMRNDGQVVHRELTVCRVNPGGGKDGKDDLLPYSQEGLAALRKLYGKHTGEPGQAVHTFAGTFRGRLPADLGGGGAFTSLESSMGGVAG